jgi:non-specific serine/threonine protein kinase
LDETAWETAYAEGKAKGLEEAIEYALSDEGLASHGVHDAPEHPAPAHPSASEQSLGLTRREKEIGALLAQGLSNRQIAEELFVSERTVENHVSNILKKLNLNSREQVASRLSGL